MARNDGSECWFSVGPLPQLNQGLSIGMLVRTSIGYKDSMFS